MGDSVQKKFREFEVNRQGKSDDPRFKRRLRFSLIVIVSQMLLIALAVGWGLYLILISKNGGSIISAETNRPILYGEIIATGLIVVLAFVVIVMELKRLTAKRSEDRLNARNKPDTTP